MSTGQTYSKSCNSRVENTLHHGDWPRAARSNGHAYKAPRISFTEILIPGTSLSSLCAMGSAYLAAHCEANCIYVSAKNLTRHGQQFTWWDGRRENLGQDFQGVIHETGSSRSVTIRKVTFSTSRPKNPVAKKYEESTTLWTGLDITTSVEKVG